MFDLVTPSLDMRRVPEISLPIHHPPRSHDILKQGKREPRRIRFRLSMDKIMSMFRILPLLTVRDEENIVLDPTNAGRAVCSLSSESVRQGYAGFRRPIRGVLL